MNLGLNEAAKYALSLDGVTLAVFLVFIFTLILYYAKKYRAINIKAGASKLFLKASVSVNSTFFNIFRKKSKNATIFPLLFLLIGVIMLIFNITFLVILQNKTSILSDSEIRGLFDFDSKIRVWNIPIGAINLISIFTLSSSVCIWLISLILLIEILKIRKEYKIWETKNNNLQGASAFENLTSEENQRFLNVFCDENLTIIFYVQYWNSIQIPYKIKFKNWKKSLLKNKDNLDNEFYYFLILNYKNISIKNNFYEIKDYAYIYQNRKAVFNEENNLIF
ncbi:hypothetical protein DA803_01845 [[Mycoplasma] phocae]|uniref:Uncharacterized protein n=1 Tax=[Mycoplasma] phocae TaxID=142651 RepID=A0A2Z5IQH3_9BACT|nr:hypothetical protein [[Mycoplasma] phocae]AXE60827.1 hypothetical protein DA803_01845 [[Mycoplasma] phocae]